MHGCFGRRRVPNPTDCRQPQAVFGSWTTVKSAKCACFVTRTAGYSTNSRFAPNAAAGLLKTQKGNIWVSSTVGFEIICYDPETGKELAAFPTPWLESNPTLPHGLIWADGHLWVATQFPGALVELDPATGEVVHWIRVSGDRTHGIAWEDEGLWRLRTKPPSGGDNADGNGQRSDDPWRSPRGLPALWCVDTNRRAVFRLDPETGGILDAFGVAGPEAHGMTIHDGTFWMCDAETGEVFVLER